MKLNNEFAKKKYELIRHLERELAIYPKNFDRIASLKAEIDTFDAKSKELIETTLKNKAAKIKDMEFRLNKIRTSGKSDRQIYKDSCDLYQEIHALLLEVRDIKAFYRNEVYGKYKKK